LETDQLIRPDTLPTQPSKTTGVPSAETTSNM
jgi:hypothetical protein